MIPDMTTTTPGTPSKTLDQEILEIVDEMARAAVRREERRKIAEGEDNEGQSKH